jgi:hypothetical protein
MRDINLDINFQPGSGFDPRFASAISGNVSEFKFAACTCTWNSCHFNQTSLSISCKLAAYCGANPSTPFDIWPPLWWKLE